MKLCGMNSAGSRWAPVACFCEHVRLQILTWSSAKMTVFWDVSLCSLVEMTGVSEVHTAPIIRTLTEVVSISEISVSFY